MIFQRNIIGNYFDIYSKMMLILVYTKDNSVGAKYSVLYEIDPLNDKIY